MFTRQELRVLVFLVVSLFLGITVWAYRSRWQPLPELVEEGRVVLAPSESPPVPVARGAEADSGVRKVVLNQATREELETIPGIGPVTAGRIVEYRDRTGGYRSIEELLDVKGIGQSTLNKIKSHVQLN